MVVSKRLRYEVLRRDNYTCRYCGAQAPNVAITVDHVIPESLGGSDSPENLVAACSDCNSGKTSSMPDAPLVAAVAEDAARWVAAMRQAVEENRMNDNSAVYSAVVGAWTSFRRQREIPGDYRETIDYYLNGGLPAADIVAMARVADSKSHVDDRWAYFCGCCRNRLRQLQERAQVIFTATVGEAAVDTQATVDLTEVTRWFKPLWYGYAWDTGYRRLFQIPDEELATSQYWWGDIPAGESGHIDADGCQHTSHAPRPQQWIEVVAGYLDRGLSKPHIEHHLSVAMNAGVSATDLWSLFVASCLAQLADDEQNVPDG